MGLGELVIILVITLILIGPSRLPEIAQKLGQFWHKLTQFNEKIKEDLDEELKISQLKQNIELAEKAEKENQHEEQSKS